MARRRAVAQEDEPTPAQRAVGKFDEAQAELQEFISENHELTDELRRLIENYNAALKESAITVKSELQNSERSKLVVGQFGATKRNRSHWDGHKICALFPRGVSDMVLTERIEYTIDVKKLEQLQRQGEIDAELARQAFVDKPPSLSLMPGCPKELNF